MSDAFLAIGCTDVKLVLSCSVYLCLTSMEVELRDMLGDENSRASLLMQTWQSRTEGWVLQNGNSRFQGPIWVNLLEVAFLL